MNSLALELFVGPAVVVDDEVNQTNTTAHAIAEELGQSHFPVIRRRVIPDDNEIAHWRSMSLIVLDWDLGGTASIAPDDDESVEDNDPSLFGLDMPDTIKRDPKRDSLLFVRKLIRELYCPVFIVSNLGVAGIWAELKEGLDRDQIRQLEARVLVRSKTQAEGLLLDGLSDWIADHPAIYALKTWERAYERAKSALFQDFQASSVEWPGILWNTSREDGTNPDHDLTQTISRNLLHRMAPRVFDHKTAPRVFDYDSIASTQCPELRDSVRRVLHREAVIPSDRLHDDMIMPGDFFLGDEEDHHPPQSIDICLTPACDLVARGEDKADDIKMFMVRALLVQDEALATPKAIDKMLKSDLTTSVVLHHLVPDDAMYVVRFKNWSVTTWGKVKSRRLGRLLDPYVTLLQQRYALFSQRQGLPRLPDDFYKPRTQSG